MQLGLLPEGRDQARVSDRVLALADGRPLAMGTAAEVQSDPAVIEAYIGVEQSA